MKLHIANCTKQDHVFMYGVEGHIRHYQREIRAGGQIVINEDGRLSRGELEGIIKQHSKYGFIEMSDLKFTDAYVGLAYRWDKSIDSETIMEGIEHNDQALTDRGTLIRENSTAALSKSLSESLQGTGSNLNALDVEVIEQQRDQADNGTKFKQKITIGDREKPARGRPRKTA